MKACFDEAVGATDVGRRSHNEDTYLLRPELGLMMVADGVGGHLAGEIASSITCETVQRELERGTGLEEAVRCANREVMYAVEAGRGNHGMASTVVAMCLRGADYELAWVGDSRAYLWDGQLKLLTRDHSLMEVLFERGQASREELRTHPQRNVIVQAIGLQAEDNLKVGLNRGTLRRGQILMLCSDGLSDVLENATIVELMNAGGSLQERCQQLVTASIEQGGKDNSTVILVSGSAEAVDGRSPEVVWSFDPVTGEISQPAVDAEAGGTGAAGEKPGGGEERRTPQTTQMMSLAELEQALAEKREEQVAAQAEPAAGAPPGSLHWKLLAAGAAVLLVVAAFALL